KAVVEQLSVRHGRLLGHKSHALSLQLDQAPEKVLETFVEQYYLAIEEVVELPKEVLLSHAINSTTLAEALFQRHGRRLRFAHQVRGQRQAWRRLAEENARHSMANVLANQQNMGQRLIALQEAVDLAVLPERIECFDISHRSEEHTSELQSRFDLVCRLLLEKKKTKEVDKLLVAIEICLSKRPYSSINYY